MTWRRTRLFPEINPAQHKNLWTKLPLGHLLTNFNYTQKVQRDENIIFEINSLKLLGVTLSKDLRWNVYIDSLIKKTSKRLYFISQLKRAKVSPEDLIKFYVACIRSVLLYACQVYHYNLPEYLSRSLEQIQKRI